MDFVPLLSTPNIPAHEKSCITTVVGLFQMTELLAPTEIRRKRKRFHDGPSDEKTVAAIYDATASFWTALKKHIPQIRAVCSSKPAEQLASKYRHADGGHLLFRPVGMKAFAKATRTLAKVSLDVADEFWREVLWRPETKTMLNKYGRLAHNVFLCEIGEPPESKKYAIQKEYKRITGREYPDRR
jgi:DNA sulfur modification protein DndB